MVQDTPHRGGREYGLQAVYLVRLFIYHGRLMSLHPSSRPFQTAVRLDGAKLANIITTPGMVVAVSMAARLTSESAHLAAAGVDAYQVGFRRSVVGLPLVLLQADGVPVQRGDCQWNGRQLRVERATHIAA